MSDKTMFSVFVVAIMLALALFAILALSTSADELSAPDAHSADAIAQRTTTISVPSGASVYIYPEAGHTSAEVRWKCVGGKYRAASDSIRPQCSKIVLTSRIWFTYAVIRSRQQEA